MKNNKRKKDRKRKKRFRNLKVPKSGAGSKWAGPCFLVRFASAKQRRSDAHGRHIESAPVCGASVGVQLRVVAGVIEELPCFQLHKYGTGIDSLLAFCCLLGALSGFAITTKGFHTLGGVGIGSVYLWFGAL